MQPTLPTQPVLPLLPADLGLPVDAPFTAAQARDAGVPRHRLEKLLVHGYLRRMLKGIYVASHLRDDVALRLRALSLVAPPDTVVSDWTATWIHCGILAFGGHQQVPPVSLYRPPGHGRLRNDLSRSGERDLRPDDVVVMDGLVVTTPLRTAWDVGRFSRRDDAIGGLDALLRLGAFDRDELVAGVERFRRQRGVVQLRALAPLADPRAESPGESVLRLRWLDLERLPPPELQVPIHTRDGRLLYRLDLGVPELRFFVEYDGEEHHTRPIDRRRDQHRRAWIERELGWTVIAVTRANVFGPDRDIESILLEGVRVARLRLARVVTP